MSEEMKTETTKMGENAMEETASQQHAADQAAVQEEPNAAAAQQQEAAQEPSSDLMGMTAIKRGSIVKGKVVKVENDQVLVDIGYKYDGVVPLRELSSVPLENAAQAVQLGQELELKVVAIDDEKEKLVLSKRAVDSERAWGELKRKMESGEIIEAQVAEVVKGGLVVDVGVRGFVPASMVELHYVDNFSDYKGRTLRLRVKELDRDKNKVILSQKDVLEEEFEANKKRILSSLSVGQVIEGTVQRITNFGVFVDIGGIDGLVHISEMAWHHVEHPSEVVKVGDSVRVKVLKVDPEAERISLSIKATQPGPWERVADEFSVGSIVKGIVKRLVSFGAFVEIMPGVEGLVHISQIAHRHIGTPHEVLKEGQEVQVKILDINPAEKRVSLSIKETEEAPRVERKSDNASSDHSSANNQGLSLTLGERFGDRLSKLK